MPESKFILILSTSGSTEEAQRIAETLVREHLVACVNIVAGIQSIFWWNDAVQKEQEVLMIMKTEREKFDQVQQAIRSVHSYEVPEIISLSLENGFEGYMQWLEDTLRR